jgi:hypothetical protein
MFGWKKFLLGVAALLVLLSLVLYVRNLSYLLPGYHFFVYTPSKYTQTLEEIRHKKSLKKNATLSQQEQFLIQSLTQKVFPYWYGTRWDFYGTSLTPGKGSIACGYFVTTTLNAIAYPLDRVKLAKCASEKMIRALVQPKYIWHFNGMELSPFCSGLLLKGKGLYIIGLDNHTGYIWAKGNGELRFIHSSGRFPFCVINEDARESVVLRNSKYKVVGKISADEKFLKTWLH